MKIIVVNVSRTSVEFPERTTRDVISGDWKLTKYEGYDFIAGVANGRVVDSFRIRTATPTPSGRVKFNLEDCNIGEKKNIGELLSSININYFSTRYYN